MKKKHKEDCHNYTIFLVTDCCAYEKNKQEKTFYPHSIEIVNIETGQTHYLKSGAKIMVFDGMITEGRSQKQYNHMKAEER